MTAMLSEPPRMRTVEPVSRGVRSVHRLPLSAAMGTALMSDWEALFARDERASAWQHPQSVFAECAHRGVACPESSKGVVFSGKARPSQSLRACRPEFGHWHRPTSGLPPLFVVCIESDALRGAAVLLPKSIRTNQAGGIGPGWMLHGYRLVGGRFLNDSPAGDVDRDLWRETLRVVREQAADFLLIEDLDDESPLARQIQDDLPAGWRAFVPNGRQARLRIQFPATGDGYWDQFSKKTRSTFRRKLKKFGETRLERIMRRGQVPEFLAQAHEISKQTWQSRQLGLRVRNSDAERESLSALADAGLLRSYLWHSDGEPAAFCIGNQAHGVFHYEEVGYATKFARFSPGQMLVVQMIDDLLADDRPEWFDFGGGDADYKRMFANRTSSSGTVWVAPPTWKGAGSLAWIQSCRALTCAARGAISSLGLATRVRQWIRYGGKAAEANGQPLPHDPLIRPVGHLLPHGGEGTVWKSPRSGKRGDESP